MDHIETLTYKRFLAMFFSGRNHNTFYKSGANGGHSQIVYWSSEQVFIVTYWYGICPPQPFKIIYLELASSNHKYHIACAVLETTAYQTHTILDAMQKDYGKGSKTLKVNGHMVENELLMKFQADILGIPVVKPKVTNISALGQLMQRVFGTVSTICESTGRWIGFGSPKWITKLVKNYMVAG